LQSAKTSFFAINNEHHLWKWEQRLPLSREETINWAVTKKMRI
jgi:hypothetical protein